MNERTTTINDIEYQHTEDVCGDIKNLITSIMKSYFHSKPAGAYVIIEDNSYFELEEYIDCYYDYFIG